MDVTAAAKRGRYILGGMLLWLPLMVGGLLLYPGSGAVYITFSVMFLLLLVDALSRNRSFGYVFLAVFLWLGFWLKHVVHLLLGYAYLEPIGSFEGGGSAWDTVLLVSTVGVMGVLIARILFRWLFRMSVDFESNAERVAPYWYSIARQWLWACVWAAIVALSIVNALYGIFQVGLNPYPLPWPLYGFVVWLMTFGLAALVATLVFWDDCTNHGWRMGLAGILTEGLLSSVSVLSRAVYLFHTLPCLLVMYGRRFSEFRIEKTVKVFVFVGWMLLLCLSLVSVMLLRYSDISPVIASSNRNISAGRTSDSPDAVAFQVFARISRLVVDRWIGLEGVMAVSAYPDKGASLLYSAIKEQRVSGRLDLYTEKIGQAKLSVDDIKRFQYAAIPGGIAFFYYTGSLWSVLIGMFSLTSLMFLSERAAFYLTKNPYLCALWGMAVAQWVASFGLGVRQMTVYWMACFGSMALIWLVQTLFSPARRQ